MNAEPTAVAIVLEMVQSRVRKLLACEDYGTAMNRAVDLDVLVTELGEAERSARGKA